MSKAMNLTKVSTTTVTVTNTIFEDVYTTLRASDQGQGPTTSLELRNEAQLLGRYAILYVHGTRAAMTTKLTCSTTDPLCQALLLYTGTTKH